MDRDPEIAAKVPDRGVLVGVALLGGSWGGGHLEEM